MTPREIATTSRIAADLAAPTPSDQALVAMQALLVSFIDATEKAGPEAMQWMSIDQVRIFNQLYLAAGR